MTKYPPHFLCMNLLKLHIYVYDIHEAKITEYNAFEQKEI